MTKKELANRIAEELDLDQVVARDVVQRTLDLILETVAQHGRIELRNFGVFEVKSRAARKARNPKTNTELLVPPRSVSARTARLSVVMPVKWYFGTSAACAVFIKPSSRPRVLASSTS